MELCSTPFLTCACVRWCVSCVVRSGNAVRGQAKTKDREKEIHAPPVLTPLGRRIWGVDKWPSKPRQTPKDTDQADAEQPASQ
jgi:hypothetical protein